MRIGTGIIQVGLILSALGCAEPTGISPRPAVQAIASERRDNSYSVDAAHTTVYVRLNRVRGEGGEPIHAFMSRVFEAADAVGARRLVVDVRSISGSDARLLVPLIKGVVARDRLSRRGGLYLIIGPDSYSPAQNAATLLEQYANPLFILE
jgi:hypothetical protein